MHERNSSTSHSRIAAAAMHCRSETMDQEVLGKLHFIKDYFKTLNIQFVPSLSSGSGGQENGDTTTENTAEGDRASASAPVTLSMGMLTSRAFTACNRCVGAECELEVW
jgi:hypothetical protein